MFRLGFGESGKLQEVGLDVASGRQVLDKIRAMVGKHESIGAVVVDLPRMPHSSNIIRSSMGLPAFDVYTWCVDCCMN